MDSNKQVFLRLLAQKPLSFRAMQSFVMAVEDWHASIGKRTIFGSSKEPKMREKAIKMCVKLLGSMWNDGMIKNIEHDAMMECIRSYSKIFFMAYPNWPVAKAFIESSEFDDAIESVITAFADDES